MNAESFNQLAILIPLCTIAAGVLIAAIKMRPANRTADEAIAAGQWQRLQSEIKRLDGRIVVLEKEVKTCHRERDDAHRDRDEWRARALTAEAASEGIGQVRTAQAIADAEERLAEQERKK